MPSAYQIWLAAEVARRADRAVGKRRLSEHERATPMSQGFLFDPGLPTVSIFIGFDVVLLRSRDKAKAAQLALLELMSKKPDGTYTTDDILRSLDEPFEDGGKWLGPAIRELCEDGLIQSVDVVQSERKSRHSGYVTAWKVADLPNALRRIRLLKQFLELRPVTKNDSKAGTNESSDSPTDIRKDEQGNG